MAETAALRFSIDLPHGPTLKFSEGIAAHVLVERGPRFTACRCSTNRSAICPMNCHVVGIWIGIAIGHKTLRMMADPGEVSDVVVVEGGHHCLIWPEPRLRDIGDVLPHFSFGVDEPRLSAWHHKLAL
jgi:hypothetical protein